MKRVKRIVKNIWKRVTCKHDYWWCAEATWSNSWGRLDHERKEITCRCKNCGKEKYITFKKSIDNF